MRKDNTIQECINTLEQELSKLVGHNVYKEGGISEMVRKTLLNASFDLLNVGIEFDQCYFKSYCPGVDKEIEFAYVKTTYKEDKRKVNGSGNTIEKVSVCLSKEIPEDLKLVDLPQWLDYNEAKATFKRIEAHQQEYLEAYSHNLEIMARMQDIMYSESYDAETTKEAEEARNILTDLML